MRNVAVILVAALAVFAGYLIVDRLTEPDPSYRGVACSDDYSTAQSRLGTHGADLWLIHCVSS